MELRVKRAGGHQPSIGVFFLRRIDHCTLDLEAPLLVSNIYLKLLLLYQLSRPAFQSLQAELAVGLINFAEAIERETGLA